MKINKNDAEKISVWNYLTQKERDRLIVKYDIKTFKKLSELEQEVIRMHVERKENAK